MIHLHAWLLRQAALWALMLRKPDLAMRCWERILKLQPDHVATLSAKAHWLASHGQGAQAIAILERLLGRNPGRAHDWFNLGFIRQAGGLHGEALEAFDKALALDPGLDRAWYGSGLSLIELKRPTEAIEALRKNTELQPQSPYGWYQLAMAYQQIGEKDKAAAVVRKLSGFEPQVARQLERDLAEVTKTGLQ